MLMSIVSHCAIDVALIRAFAAHRYPLLEVSHAESGKEIRVVIDGFKDNQQADEFAGLLEDRTGVKL